MPISPRIIETTYDTLKTTIGSLTLYANSQDLVKFHLYKGEPLPLDLTDYTVGICLMTGTRTSPTYIRPASATVLPSETGVTVKTADEGLILYRIQPTDFVLANSTQAVWLELYATKRVSITDAVQAGTGGNLTAGTYAIQVTAIVDDDLETMCLAETSVVIASGTTNKITVTWPAVAGATDFRVYRKKDAGTWNYIEVGDGDTLEYVYDTLADFTLAADPPTADIVKALLAQYRVSVMAN